MQFVDVGVYRVHLCDCRNKGVSLTYIHMERSCYASWKDWVELIIQCFFVELSLVMSCTTFAVTSSLGYSWCVDGRSCVFLHIVFDVHRAVSVTNMSGVQLEI